MKSFERRIENFPITAIPMLSYKESMRELSYVISLTPFGELNETIKDLEEHIQNEYDRIKGKIIIN